jgi:hypothetical protein
VNFVKHSNPQGHEPSCDFNVKGNTILSHLNDDGNKTDTTEKKRGGPLQVLPPAVV